MSNIQPFDRDPDTYAIIGAAMAVHSELGSGYLEAVYKDALRIEFRRRSIEFRPEVPLPIDYKGERLPRNYRVDFVCEQVLVEAKALGALTPVHESQVINYLKASGLKRGLLLNFGTASLQHRRIVGNTNRHHRDDRAGLSDFDVGARGGPQGRSVQR